MLYFVPYHDNMTSLSPFFLLLPLWNDTKKQNSPSVELLRDKNYFLCVLKKYLKKINIFICKQNYKTFWGCGFWWNWQYRQVRTWQPGWGEESLHVQVWGCGIPQPWPHRQYFCLSVKPLLILWASRSPHFLVSYLFDQNITLKWNF